MHASMKSVGAGVLLLYGVEKLLNAADYTVTGFALGLLGNLESVVLGIVALAVAYFLVK